MLSPSHTLDHADVCTGPTTEPIAEAQPVTITREQAARAFADWENQIRTEPSRFYTADEAAQMEVCSLSEGRAISFFAYLRQGAA
jgi:hypothetical protein